MALHCLSLHAVMTKSDTLE